MTGVRRTSCGFSLLEMLVVLAMIGLLAGLTISSVASTSDRDRIDHAARALVTQLTLARARAMQSGEPTRSTVTTDGRGRLTLETTNHETPRRWPLPDDSGIGFILDDGEPAESAAVRFIPVGRASAREFRAVRAREGGTIFVITFDPISGVPGLEDRPDTQQGSGS